MRLTDDEALSRLAEHDHGVLGTIHRERGADLVPCVYALGDGVVGIPVDTVKAKTSTRLQRERNLEAEPRATLLVEHWDRHDWSRLWWVRAELSRRVVDTHDDIESRLADRLVDRFEQYADRPFARILVFEVVTVTGWSAT